jgi:hypothetical protein
MSANTNFATSNTQINMEIISGSNCCKGNKIGKWDQE